MTRLITTKKQQRVTCDAKKIFSPRRNKVTFDLKKVCRLQQVEF